MTKEELQAMQEVMKAELQPIHDKLNVMDKKIDRLQFQMDTVYNWVDGLDIEVKKLKKEA